MIIKNKNEVVELFRIFVDRLKKLGYKIEHREEYAQEIAVLLNCVTEEKAGEIFTNPFEVDFEPFTEG